MEQDTTNAITTLRLETGTLRFPGKKNCAPTGMAMPIKIPMTAPPPLITKDSIKIINKLDKIYTGRSVAYIQEVAGLPLDLTALQDLLIGNPLFLDSNIVSYSRSGNSVSLLSIGPHFKNLITLVDGILHHSKLDDKDITRNRTCDLSYDDYENKKGVNFSAKRRITVSEKSKLDLKLDFKSYNFNETLSFPFSVPKNYTWN